MKKLVIGSHIEAYPYEDSKLNIYNKNTGKTFVLGEKETRVFKLLDGTNSVEDIQRLCPFYTAEELDKLISAFSDIGFFEKAKKKFNPLKIKLRLFNPNKYFKENGVVTKIFHYGICIGCPLMLIIGMLIMRFLGGERAFEMVESLSALSALSVPHVIVTVFLSLLCLALHEFAHMVTARRYGVNVTEAGVMLYFLIPCAYTNITGINLLKSKGKRLTVLLSGTLVNIGIIGLCYGVMGLCNSAVISVNCVIIMLVNLSTIFMNTMVLIKFDGYYLLETLLDEPKLREKAISHLLTWLQLTVGKDKEKKAAFKNTVNDSGSGILQHFTYCCYGVLSVSYIPFVLLNTIIPLFS